MATLAREANYEAKRLGVIAKLTEKGHLASFGVRAAGANDWDSDETYSELGTAHVFPLEWSENFSGDVQADDLMFLVAVETDVSVCTVMLDDGVEYDIVKTRRFEPDQTIIYYEVQVRR